MCEPILLRYQGPTFTTVIIRPATVCGYSPRLRLDLTVNILTSLAVTSELITIFGGTQKRPNIHIEDITDLYVELLSTPADMIAGKTFNAAYQNHTVAQLGEIVRTIVEQEMPELAPITVETSPSNDLRSYHVSSDKIKRELGWTPQRTIEDALSETCVRLPRGQGPQSEGRHPLLQRQDHPGFGPGLSDAARRRHRRGRVHREPCGGPPVDGASRWP